MSREYGEEYLEFALPAADKLVGELLNYWEDSGHIDGGYKVVVSRFKHLMEIGAIRTGIQPSPERREEISLVDEMDDEGGLTYIVIVMDPTNSYRRLVLENQENIFLGIMYDVVEHYRSLKDSGVKVPE